MFQYVACDGRIEGWLAKLLTELRNTLKNQLAYEIQEGGHEIKPAEGDIKPATDASSDEAKRIDEDAPQLHGTEEQIHLDPPGSSGCC
jgi:hypothetical protein